MIKKILANLALVAGGLLVAFGIGEIAVRALFSETTVLFPRYHTDYQYGPYHLRGARPSETYWHTSVDGRWQFITNSKGLRDQRELAYAKPPGTYRVLSLGDSHTQGYEVRQEATFSAVLERHLGAHGRKVEVLNAGISGFSNAEELAFLENEGHRYQPDVVVLGFFANDFEDNVKAGLFDLDQQGQLIAKKFEHIPGVRIQNFIYALPGVRWLSENSHFYSTVFNGLWVYFKFKLNDQAAAQVGRQLPEYAIGTHQNHSDREVALAAALVERLKRFCDERGIRFVLVDIPNPFPNERYRFATSLPAPFRDRLKNAKIEFVDSDELLRPYAGSVEIHVPHGYQHLSEFGHGLVGVDLGRRLLDRPRP